MNNIQISIYLDERRKKDNGLYPVKLRVYQPTTKKVKLYPFNKFKIDENSNVEQKKELSKILDILNNGLKSQKALDEILNSKKPNKIIASLQLFLNDCLQNAKKIAVSLKPFSNQQFEKNLFDFRLSDDNQLIRCYNEIIDSFARKGRISTASGYDLSLKSLTNFAESIKLKLSFEIITTDFLEKYETYMLSDKQKKSITTVSMYLRGLRSIFNYAITQNVIMKEYYPFGIDKYTIPTGDKVKKALTKAQLLILHNGLAQTEEQQKAKDFWFFSYFAQGMNMKDISMLKFSNIKEDSIQYYREKTRRTGNKKPRLIYLIITDEMQKTIDKYSNVMKSESDFVFPILTNKMTAQEQHRSVQNFTRYVNQHFKKYAKHNGINEAISTYWARHSFTTTLINNGASIEFASEALNHKNIKTTQNYMAGFEEYRRKEKMQELSKF